jgi:hypothetical protein
MVGFAMTKLLVLSHRTPEEAVRAKFERFLAQQDKRAMPPGAMTSRQAMR